MKALHGVIPAMVSPRDAARDDLDVAALARISHHFLQAGVHALFPMSSTGEAPLLSRDQRREAIETVVQVAAGQVPVLAGVGTPSTAQSVQLARDAQDAGASCLVVLPLHFVPLSHDDLYGYFAAVADSVDIPTLLYNYPARTGGQNIPAAVAAKLAERHQVVGIKDSGGDLANSLGYRAACPDDFAVFVGSEALIYPALASGCAGTICAAANVFPRQIVALYEDFRAGDHAAARRVQECLVPLRSAFGVGTFPAGVKAAMDLVGEPVGDPFPPTSPLTPAQRAQIGPLLEAVTAGVLDKPSGLSL